MESDYFFGQLQAAENVEMQVHDGLATVLAAVVDDAVAIVKPLGLGDLRYRLKALCDIFGVAAVYHGSAADVRLRHDKDVHGSLRVYIAERENILVLIYLGAGYLAAGMCTSYPNGGVVVNFGTIETSSRSVEVGKQLEKYFNEGGAKAVFREDILPLVWWKVIKNSSHSPVSAVLRLSIGDTDRCQYGRELYNRVIREGVAVAKAKGIQIMDADEFIAHDHEQCLENGPYVNSMTQDVCWKKLPTEVDMLCGALSEQGKLVGVPTPTCDVLTLIIKSIERNYDNQLKDKPV